MINTENSPGRQADGVADYKQAVLQSFQSCSTVQQYLSLLRYFLGGPRGSKIRPPAASPMMLIQRQGPCWGFLGALGATLSAQEALRAPTWCRLAIQIASTWQSWLQNSVSQANLASDLVPSCSPSWFFLRFLTLRTLIFAVPYNVFHGFSIIQHIASKTSSKLWNNLQISYKSLLNAFKSEPESPSSQIGPVECAERLNNQSN